MGLARYQEMRDFTKTPEPRGGTTSAAGSSFVVQMHAATRLHYDFRLELDGVLLSWAVPKGPSYDPASKRLAVRTEDHPLEYGGFEGVIPEGEYGGGNVVVWDRGTWSPIGDAHAGLKKGHLQFTLEGQKLRGRWHLVRGRRGGPGKEQWLLFKGKDEHADAAVDVVREQPLSVLSGRSLDQVGADRDRVWDHGGERGGMPKQIEPELATVADSVPDGDGWVHEIKYDGYRILARIAGDGVRLLSRNGRDWTREMSSVAAACRGLASEAWLDGEVVVQRPDGVSEFQALQTDLGAGRTDRLQYFVFDLLWLDGEDLRPLPLLERKERLHALIGGGSGRLRFSEHVVGNGRAFFDQACAMGLEGSISKKRTAPYRSDRGRDWLKNKRAKEDDVVIGGYTPPKGARQGFGAVLVGRNDGAGLVYAGKVGSGFGEAAIRDLKRRFDGLETKVSPFVGEVPREDSRQVTWLRPELVATIGYGEITRDGRYRHPRYRGLREDVVPTGGAMTEAATEAVVAGVRLSHPGKVLWGSGTTKLDLARFYESIADRILPHVVERPLTVVRCPNGAQKPCFFQKHLKAGMLPDVHAIPITEGDAEEPYMWIDSLAGLVSLVQVGALELHPWSSKVDKIERPDRLIFDFDPDPDLPFPRVAEAAIECRDRLAALGLESWLKTTGGKGLHVVVPIARRSTWDEVREFSEAIARSMAADSPEKYVDVMSKAKRKGRIFIDYLRNARGATAVAAWSTRTQDRPTLSVPIAWEQLVDVRPSTFDIGNVQPQLARPDPWAGFFESRQALTATMRKTASTG